MPSVVSTTNRFTTGQGYAYDPNGNITGDVDAATGQSRTFTFNGDNKQTEVRNSSNVIIGTYFYDGNGNRVKKVTDAETTIFVYDGLGKLVAEYSTATPPASPTINYTATDTLGSPRVITNGSGQVVSRRDFMPFGEELFADGTYRTTAAKYSTTGFDAVRQRFTGYQRDAETNLDFAEASYYQNAHGRFTAVDPLLASGKSADPQTFNRYVYVMNNPLILVDPTGLQASKNPDEEETVAYIQSLPACGFLCKIRSSIASGFNYLIRSIVGKDNWYNEENIANAERKRGGVQNVDKQVGNGVKNYLNDLNTVTNAVIDNEPTGVGNVVKVTVDNEIGRADGGDLVNAYLGAAVNTATSLAPGGKLLSGGSKLVKHHIFNVFRGNSAKSEVYRQFFKVHGIDVEAFQVLIPEEMHRKFIHAAGNNWTTKWKEFIDANPNATTKEVYQFAGKLMDEFGISGVSFIQ